MINFIFSGSLFCTNNYFGKVSLAHVCTLDCLNVKSIMPRFQSAEIYLIINNNQNRRQYNDDIRSK